MEDLNPLLNMLPPQVQVFVLSALIVFCTLWLSLLSMRWLVLKFMGPPSANDSPRKTLAYTCLQWLDLVSPETIRSMLEIARKEKEIRKLHASQYPAAPFHEDVERTTAMPPPPPRCES